MMAPPRSWRSSPRSLRRRSRACTDSWGDTQTHAEAGTPAEREAGRLRDHGSWTGEPDAQVTHLDLELVEPGVGERGGEQVDRGEDRVAICHQASYRRKTSVALCPPKPKLLLIPTVTSTSRASFGT